VAQLMIVAIPCHNRVYTSTFKLSASTFDNAKIEYYQAFSQNLVFILFIILIVQIVHFLTYVLHLQHHMLKQ
jgi:hypothetical protein